VKQILVVGGSGGLGNALVAALLDQHYQVAVTGRKPATDPRVAAFRAIETTNTDWPALYQSLEQETGAPIDAVIFVSGTAVYGKALMVPPDRARQVMELNFWTCIHAAQAAAEHWNSSQRPGKFLAVLSIVALHGIPFEAHYSASKAATASFLQCLDLENGGKGMEFISAFPGALNTPFRGTSEWYGLEASRCEGGADPSVTAQALIALMTGKRRARVIGWRERAIVLADRIWPGLYDRMVLRARVRKLLESQPKTSAGKLSGEDLIQEKQAAPDTPHF
jgi:3-oxoacyl-[acyl-carrier protein] reductase